MKSIHDTGRNHCRRGLTLVELFFVILIIGILAGMLLPATRSTREAARRTTCANHLRQLVLANLNYESSHGHFPAAMGGPDFQMDGKPEAMNRRSGLILLLPLIEQSATWEQISKPSKLNGREFPAMGPEPWDPDYPPWQSEISDFRCPSANSGETGFGETNYAFCIGDMARGVHQPNHLRGAFACQLNSTLAGITDGTSCTIAMAEIGTSDRKLVRAHYVVDQPAALLDDPSRCFRTMDAKREGYYDPEFTLAVPGRGGCWADGAAGCSLFNTVLPPNSPSGAVDGGQATDGIYSAGSFHVGLVNVAMVDGSVHPLREDIDAGDPTQSTLTATQLADNLPSPFGIWGAMGTAAAADVTDP